MEDYTKEQLWKIYKTLPEELKETIFSAETADNIGNVCEKNGVKDDKVSEVAKHTGRVLLGLLPPDELQKTLEKEVAIEEEIAKNIAREINRFVFFPVKESLAALHKIEAKTSADSSATPPLSELIKPARREETKGNDAYNRDDTYRETVE